MANPVSQMCDDLRPTAVGPPGPLIRSRYVRAGGRLVLFLFGLLLFVLAMMLMKASARSLAPLMQGTLDVTTPARTLGFGWLFAYVVLSGSPVAAIALALLDVDILTPASTFTMITGSRLGANFILILLGFIYVLRRHSSAAGLTMAMLSFAVTATTHALGLLIGFGLLAWGVLERLHLAPGVTLHGFFHRILRPILMTVDTTLPNWTIFVIGVLMILGSFYLFDRCIPQMAIKESQVGRVSRLVYSRWVMFALGGAVTLISMSVSVSLGILLPLSARGFIRRENVIPYIMGANVTTFVDTLFASLLIDDPAGFRVVAAEMISIALVSLVLLATVYPRYERAMLAVAQWSTASTRQLLFALVVVLLIPILLLFV